LLSETVDHLNSLHLSENEKLVDDFNLCTVHPFKGKGKGKAIPLQPWTGYEGSRRMRLPDFRTIGT
jgi:hypothetical protein